MLISRFVNILAVPVLLLAAADQAVSEKVAEKTPASGDQFQGYSEDYFRQRNLEFDRGMAEHELFLAWLYQGINAEVRERQKEDWRGTLEAISPPELEGLADSLYLVAEGLKDAPLRIRYMAWERLQQDEFDHKFYQARLVKDRLISSGTPQQRLRMFRWDLESALTSFRDQFYPDAVTLFTEAIERYGYSNLADLHFYRGESFFALRLLDQAKDDYQQVLRLDDPEYNRRAVERLLVIAGDMGDREALESLWERFRSEAGGGEDYTRVLEPTARYLFAMRGWRPAQGLFDEIPEGSERYWRSRLRGGDCSLAMLELDDAQRRYLEIVENPDQKARKQLAAEIREANLKLGYISFLKGDFEGAIQQFKLLDGEDELAQKAGMVSAWCWFRLLDYGRAGVICNDLLRRFPETPYYYEIHCLLGYCNEVLGQADGAARNYQTVMDAIDNRQYYHDFNYEERTVLEALLNLQRLEPMLFVEGHSEFFDRYLSLQRRLVTLTNNIQLSKGARTSPVLVDLVEERSAVNRLVKERGSLDGRISTLEDVKLARESEALSGKLGELATELNAGIRYYLRQRSLVQREEDQEFRRMLADSLNAGLRHEWDAVERSLKRIQELMPEVCRSGDRELMFALAGLETDLMGLKRQMMAVRGGVSGVEAEPIISNLDWWSWLAYHRHCTDCVAFDEYYARQERLSDLENYIARINRVLAERRGVVAEEIGLPENLVLASEPGQAPYYPPPAPMWRSLEAAPGEAPPVEEVPGIEEAPQEPEEGIEEAPPEEVKPQEGAAGPEGAAGEVEKAPEEEPQVAPTGEPAPEELGGKGTEPPPAEPAPEQPAPAGEPQPEEGGSVETPRGGNQ